LTTEAQTTFLVTAFADLSNPARLRYREERALRFALLRHIH
jgi:hypothetical protein